LWQRDGHGQIILSSSDTQRPLVGSCDLRQLTIVKRFARRPLLASISNSSAPGRNRTCCLSVRRCAQRLPARPGTSQITPFRIRLTVTGALRVPTCPGGSREIREHFCEQV